MSLSSAAVNVICGGFECFRSTPTQSSICKSRRRFASVLGRPEVSRVSNLGRSSFAASAEAEEVDDAEDGLELITIGDTALSPESFILI